VLKFRLLSAGRLLTRRGFPIRNPQEVHFAGYVLDLETAELRSNGTKVILQDQPFQILATLIEAQGRLVTRNELIKKLWPAGTFVDFDQSLNKAVGRLREALGDNADDPMFVETVPRRGYRFVVPTKNIVVPNRQMQDSSALRIPRETKMALAIASLFILMLVAALLVYRTRSTAPFQKTDITRLTNDGKVMTAAISPDGRYVAYATAENADFVEKPFTGKESLWVRQIGSGSDVQITPPSAVHYGGLTFSRDGNVLYITQSESKDRSLGTLYRMPVLGGIKKKIVASTAVLIRPTTANDTAFSATARSRHAAARRSARRAVGAGGLMRPA